MFLLLIFTLFFACITLAQDPTNANGDVFSCPVGDSALQAYSTLCPLYLNDGTTTLSYKYTFVGYSAAPTNYKTGFGDVPHVLHALTELIYVDINCVYQGGEGNQLTLRDPDASCPGTTRDNGRDPKPSGGGNFRKRQSEIQTQQPSVVCPLETVSSSMYLTQTSYDFDPARSTNRLYCTYNGVSGTSAGVYCVYDATTGGVILGDAGCPLIPCSSPPYRNSMARRSIVSRQVVTAKLRARAAKPGSKSKVSRDPPKKQLRRFKASV